jgi:hypothetical protein
VGRAAKALQVHDQRNLQTKQQLVDRCVQLSLVLTRSAFSRENDREL